MTEQSSGHGRDDWNRDGYVPGEQYAGEQYYDADESDSGANDLVGRISGRAEGSGLVMPSGSSTCTVLSRASTWVSEE